MATVRIQIANRNASNAQVKLVADIEPTNGFYKFLYPAFDSKSDKGKTLPTKYPFLTYAAIEAAIESGVYYAKHKTTAKTYSVSVSECSCVGDAVDAIPFALAIALAVYFAMENASAIAEKDLSGWEIITLEKK